jgi:hypothetical protein
MIPQQAIYFVQSRAYDCCQGTQGWSGKPI